MNQKYKNKCLIIFNLVKNEFPKNNFKLQNNKIIFEDGREITILYDNSWDEVKRHIYKKLEQNYGDCSICFNNISQNVSCPKCSNNFCVECYINIFKSNKGLIKCPHCRFTYGNIMNNQQINQGIQMIRSKIR